MFFFCWNSWLTCPTMLLEFDWLISANQIWPHLFLLKDKKILSLGRFVHKTPVCFFSDILPIWNCTVLMHFWNCTDFHTQIIILWCSALSHIENRVEREPLLGMLPLEHHLPSMFLKMIYVFKNERQSHLCFFKIDRKKDLCFFSENDH